MLRLQALLLLLLFFVSLVVVVVPGSPTGSDPTTNTITRIVNIARTTLVRIEKLRTQLRVERVMEYTPPTITGLTSINHHLGLLAKELQVPSTEYLIQIQTDVSSLGGSVRTLALDRDCPIRDPPSGQTEGDAFPVSRLYLTVTKVQSYLESFILNQDKLKVC